MPSFAPDDVGEAVPAPGRVRMSKGDRRKAILDESIRIIGEQGYRGFSINDLARRCGLTTAGLLHHFGSKEGLLVALLEERDRDDQHALRAKLGLRRGQPLSREQVLHVLRAIVAQNSLRPHMVRLHAILRAEALGPDHPARAYFEDREQAVLTSLGDMVAAHVEDAAETALQLHATMSGLEVHWLRMDCGFDLVAAWDRAAAKLLR